MKKLFALLLAIVMVCTVFAGCVNEVDPGTQGTQGTQGTEGTEGTTPTEPETFKNTDVYPLEGTPALTIGVSLENAENAYYFKLMADTIGVDPTYRYITNEQAPLLFADLESMPDLLFTGTGRFGLSVEQINGYGEEGALINFMDYLDKMPNLAQAYADHPELFDACMTFDGKVYTLPRFLSNLKGNNNLLYYREDHMKLAGWDKAPTTTEEFREYLRDLKEHFGATDPQYIPFTVYQASHLGYNGQVSRFLFPSFGDLMEAGIAADSTGKKIVAGFATEQYKRYVTYLNSLMKEGLLDPDAFSAKNALMKAFMNEGHTSVNSLMVYMPESAFPSGNIDLIIPGTLESEYNNDVKWAMPATTTAWGGMVPTNCKNLDAALAYLDAFYSTEENPLNEKGTVWGFCFSMGELGVTWEWKEPGKSYQELPIDLGEYSTRAEYNVGNGYSASPYAGICYFLDYDENGEVGFKAVNVMNNLIPDAVFITRAAVLQLSEEENDIYKDAWQDISKYIAEMNAAFITGTKDVNTEWDTYIKTLDEMGLQDVLEVYQAALDRYIARQEANLKK